MPLLIFTPMLSSKEDLAFNICKWPQFLLSTLSLFIIIIWSIYLFLYIYYIFNLYFYYYYYIYLYIYIFILFFFTFFSTNHFENSFSWVEGLLETVYLSEQDRSKDCVLPSPWPDSTLVGLNRVCCCCPLFIGSSE